MSLQFASCQWNPYAKSFIQKMYPGKEIMDSEIPLLIALINEDVLRVQDPEMHRPCGIVAGKNYSDSRSDDIAKAINQFTENVHNSTQGGEL